MENGEIMIDMGSDVADEHFNQIPDLRSVCNILQTPFSHKIHLLQKADERRLDLRPVGPVTDLEEDVVERE